MTAKTTSLSTALHTVKRAVAVTKTAQGFRVTFPEFTNDDAAMGALVAAAHLAGLTSRHVSFLPVDFCRKGGPIFAVSAGQPLRGVV